MSNFNNDNFVYVYLVRGYRNQMLKKIDFINFCKCQKLKLQCEKKYCRLKATHSVS